MFIHVDTLEGCFTKENLQLVVEATRQRMARNMVNLRHASSEAEALKLIRTDYVPFEALQVGAILIKEDSAGQWVFEDKSYGSPWDAIDACEAFQENA